jgi:hypothetical protein
MRTLILLALLLRPAVSWSAVLDAAAASSGTLATAQTATGASANSIKMGPQTKFRTLVVTMTNTAGTATVQLEVNCTGAAADWALVPGTSSSLTVSAAAASVTYPLCSYRTNVTACGTCSVNVAYAIGPEMQ